jgi:hypothetical protein
MQALCPTKETQVNYQFLKGTYDLFIYYQLL